MSTNEPPPEQPGRHDLPPTDLPPRATAALPSRPRLPRAGTAHRRRPPQPAGPDAATGEYNVGTAFTYGWNKFTANVGQVLIAIAVLLAIAIAIQIVGWIIGNAVACEAEASYTDSGLELDGCTGVLVAQNIVSFLFGLVTWVVSMIIGAGVVRGALKVTEGEQFDARTLLTPHRLPEVVIAAVLVGVATFIGLVALRAARTGGHVLHVVHAVLPDGPRRPRCRRRDQGERRVHHEERRQRDPLVPAQPGRVVRRRVALRHRPDRRRPVVIFGTAYTYKKLSGQEVAA